MNKKYKANSIKLEEIKNRKNRYVFEIIAGIILMIIGIFLNMSYSEYDRYFKTEDYEICHTVGIILIIGGIAGAVLTIFQLVHNNAIEINYKNSYIHLEDDIVSGISYQSPDQTNQGMFFSIKYEDINDVFVHDFQPLNLAISSKQGTYSCLEITAAHMAAREIREMVDLHKNSDPESVTNIDFVKNKAEGELFFCRYCGTKLPNDASYGGKCGKKLI